METCDKCKKKTSNALALPKGDGLWQAVVPLVQRFKCLCDDCRDETIDTEYLTCDCCGKYVLKHNLTNGECRECIQGHKDYWDEEKELSTRFWRN